MSNLHLPLEGRVENFGAVSSGASTGTSLSSGTITQIAAATNFDYDALLVTVISNTSSVFTIDVLLGSSGNEYVVAETLYVVKSGTEEGSSFLLPLAIPRGSRICLRSNGAASNAVIHGISYGRLGPRGYSRIRAMGVSSNKGTAVDPGTTANTLSSWVQITASAPGNFDGLMPIIGNNNRSSSAAGNSWLVDIGLGSPQQIIIPRLLLGSGSSTQLLTLPNVLPIFPVQIPTGSALYARAQSNATSSTQRAIDVALYGLVR